MAIRASKGAVDGAVLVDPDACCCGDEAGTLRSLKEFESRSVAEGGAAVALSEDCIWEAA